MLLQSYIGHLVSFYCHRPELKILNIHTEDRNLFLETFPKFFVAFFVMSCVLMHSLDLQVNLPLIIKSCLKALFTHLFVLSCAGVQKIQSTSKTHKIPRHQCSEKGNNQLHIFAPDLIIPHRRRLQETPNSPGCSR